jgi:NADH dehydrogenase [ubiquinone] 1 alpha subcomplex assembly factor 7
MPLERPASSLKERLAARIAAEGPLTLEDYMQACLLDDTEGAYAAKQPIGAEGHFITAPEISQIFGELIGLWAAAIWQSMGEPARVIVAELGPGRGTMLADAVRAWRVVPRFAESVSIALVERSPRLAALQREALKAAGVPLTWFARLEDVPPCPTILVANEFVDALPIRQFVRRGKIWNERLVDNGQGGLSLVEGPPAAGAEEFLAGQGDAVPEGAIVEHRPGIANILRAMARRADAAAFAALIVDYGHDVSGFGDTLQAVRRHRYADPLADPGDADLTSQVDFAELKWVAESLGLKAYGPMPQGHFLLPLGLEARRDRLLKAARPEQQSAILTGAARLVDPQQMGAHFKVLALASVDLPPPPPFAGRNLSLSSSQAS